MTLSFWRYSHLALALFSSLFLILASLTGVILAVDAVQERALGYRAENFDSITLEETLPVLRSTYPEITEVAVNHNQFVTLQGIDQKENTINAYIDPRTGQILGIPAKKNDFINWITALHRSLFLKETGRFVVGFISFLLVLLSISGFVLVLKRQRSIRSLYSKIVKENFAQYYHIYLGRLTLIPILALALSGTYLTLEKFHFFIEKTDADPKTTIVRKTAVSKKTAASFFKNTLLTDVQKIEFPFSDDPEDYYLITLKDRKIEVNQVTGAVISESALPVKDQLADWSLNIHTGRSSILWAIILGAASLNILFFIYSGFAMTLKRRSSQIKNKFKADESRFILLAGSENGSTLRFANAIHKQLIDLGEKVFITELNNYTAYPKAEYLIIFTSTHGLGDAPSNADKFLSLINRTQQQQKIKVSTIGFGSKAYQDFCGFAYKIDAVMAEQNWAERHIELQTVNDKSPEEFVIWTKLWSAKTGIPLSATSSAYNEVPKDLEKMTVVDKTKISPNGYTFLLTLRPNRRRVGFDSGDLLAIYPAGDTRERLYSIGTIRGSIQLAVKLHPLGLGSGYLYNLSPGEVIKARIIKNPAFHFPEKASKAVLISNGTGIAPFLGMLEQNKKKTEIHLYCGFRRATETVLGYEKFANEMIKKQQLKSFNLALSREMNQEYVMNLIKRDGDLFVDLLTHGGVIMICGSIAMQKDVESALDKIISHTALNISDYKASGQILMDCY